MIKKFDRYIILVILAILLGIFLRFYKFDTIPYGLNHDGAQDALQALDLMRHPLPYKAFFAGGSGETLFKYYLAFIMKLLGISIVSIRFGSTLLAACAIPFFFMFVKKLTNKGVALCATFLFAVSGWHIIMGRTVWRAIATPLIEVIMLYFLVRAIKEGRLLFYALSGLFLALSLHTYNAARSLPIFVGLVLLYKFFQKGDLKKKFLSFVIFIIPFIIVSFPLALYAKTNPQEFNSRLDSLSVVNRIELTHSLTPLFDNLKTSALIFNVKANGDDFFTTQPLLDQPAALLFIVGLLYLLYKIKKPEHQFVLFGLLITLLPGLISVPNGNRAIAAMPFVYLIADIGFFVIFQTTKKITKNNFYPILLAFIITLFAIYTAYTVYFGQHRRMIFGFNPEATIVGNYMKSYPNYDFYLTDNYPRDTLTFLTYRGGDPYIKHYRWFEHKEDFLSVAPHNKPLTFVMFDNEQNLAFVEKLKNRFPSGTVHKLLYNDGIETHAAGLLYEISSLCL